MSLNLQNIAKSLLTDKFYISYCNTLVKKRKYLADDLLQLTALSVLETTDDRFEIAQSNKILKPYLIGVINNIWTRRNKHKLTTKSNTHDLFEYTSSLQTTPEIIEHIIDNQPSTVNTHELVDTIIAQISKDCQSNDDKLFYMAKVFNFVNDNVTELEPVGYDSVREFSKDIGINFCSLYKAINNYKKHLKIQIQNEL